MSLSSSIPGLRDSTAAHGKARSGRRTLRLDILSALSTHGEVTTRTLGHSPDTAARHAALRGQNANTALKLLGSADASSDIKACVERVHEIHGAGALTRDLGCAANTLLDCPSQIFAAHLVDISSIRTAAHSRILCQVGALGTCGAERAFRNHDPAGARCRGPRIFTIQLAARSLRLIVCKLSGAAQTSSNRKALALSGAEIHAAKTDATGKGTLRAHIGASRSHFPAQLFASFGGHWRRNFCSSWIISTAQRLEGLGVGIAASRNRIFVEFGARLTRVASHASCPSPDTLLVQRATRVDNVHVRQLRR